MVQPSDTERAIFWTKWKLQQWFRSPSPGEPRPIGRKIRNKALLLLIIGLLLFYTRSYMLQGDQDHIRHLNDVEGHLKALEPSWGSINKMGVISEDLLIDGGKIDYEEEEDLKENSRESLAKSQAEAAAAAEIAAAKKKDSAIGESEPAAKKKESSGLGDSEISAKKKDSDIAEPEIGAKKKDSDIGDLEIAAKEKELGLGDSKLEVKKKESEVGDYKLSEKKKASGLGDDKIAGKNIGLDTASKKKVSSLGKSKKKNSALDIEDESVDVDDAENQETKKKSGQDDVDIEAKNKDELSNMEGVSGKKIKSNIDIKNKLKSNVVDEIDNEDDQEVFKKVKSDIVVGNPMESYELVEKSAKKKSKKKPKKETALEDEDYNAKPVLSKKKLDKNLDEIDSIDMGDQAGADGLNVKGKLLKERESNQLKVEYPDRKGNKDTNTKTKDESKKVAKSKKKVEEFEDENANQQGDDSIVLDQQLENKSEEQIDKPQDYKENVDDDTNVKSEMKRRNAKKKLIKE